MFELWVKSTRQDSMFLFSPNCIMVTTACWKKKYPLLVPCRQNRSGASTLILEPAGTLMPGFRLGQNVVQDFMRDQSLRLQHLTWNTELGTDLAVRRMFSHRLSRPFFSVTSTNGFSVAKKPFAAEATPWCLHDPKSPLGHWRSWPADRHPTSDCLQSRQ